MFLEDTELKRSKIWGDIAHFISSNSNKTKWSLGALCFVFSIFSTLWVRWAAGQMTMTAPFKLEAQTNRHNTSNKFSIKSSFGWFQYFTLVTLAPSAVVFALRHVFQHQRQRYCMCQMGNYKICMRLHDSAPDDVFARWLLFDWKFEMNVFCGDGARFQCYVC